MAEVNDDTDFNKARGFLLTYSGIVLALWFFGAKLTQFKLMGTEIYLEHRTNSVWMVLACLNIYFWFRCYQRLPEDGRRFNEAMHVVLDEAIIKITRLTHQRRAFRREAEDIAQDAREAEAPRTLVTLKMSGYLEYRANLEDESERAGSSPRGPWSYRYPERAKVGFSLLRHTTSGTIRGGNGYQATPGLGWYRFAVIYTLLKGAFTLPWFTDYSAPLILGIASTSVSFCMWWQVNYGGTSAIGL
jgi:hypothetical protein